MSASSIGSSIYGRISHIRHREYFLVAFILIIVISISFFNIIFLGKTLSVAAFSAGVMPSGPYSYVNTTFSDQPVIDPWASALQYEPELYLASNIYKSLDLPLWNPYAATGVPFAGDMIGAVFFPLSFIVYAVPTKYIWSTIDLMLLFRLFLAGFFTYCFMREMNFSKTGSLISACAFMLNGYLILFINMVHINVEVLIPALLFFIERYYKNRNVVYCIFSSIVIAISILGGMPESALYSFFFVGLYYLFRAYTEFGTNWKQISSRVLWLSYTFLFGVLLSSLATIPFLEYMLNSWNFHPGTLGLYHYTFNLDTISLLNPYYLGSIRSIWYRTGTYEVLPYLGIIPIFLAFTAISNKGYGGRHIRWFFAVFASLYILKTFGVPFINLFGLLPLFNVSIFPKYCFPEFALSIAILAGIGFDEILRLSFRRIVVQFLLVSCLIAIFVAKSMTSQFSKLDLEQILKASPLFTGFTITIIFLFFLAIIVIGHYRRVISPRRAGCIILMLLLLELMLYIPGERADRVNPFEPAPYIDFLKEDSSIFRVVGLDNVLMPNVASAFEIFDVRELFPMKIDIYRDFIFYTIDPFEKRFLASDLQISRENLKVFSFLNTKYILSNHDLYVRESRKNNIMIEKILKDWEIFSGNSEWIGKGDIGGQVALFQSLSSRIEYRQFVPNGPIHLDFSIGLDSQMWSPVRGDGVLFEVIVNDSGTNDKVFSKYIDPKNNPSDREYFPKSIDISRYNGKNVTLNFITSRGNSSIYDWAKWGRFVLKPSDFEDYHVDLKNDLKLVYDKEIKIYENKKVLPRAYIVQNVEAEKNEEELFDEIKYGRFDFENSVVLKYLPNAISNPNEINPTTSSSEARILSYKPNEIEVIANMTAPGYLVVSDPNYPGWTSYVDGEKTEVLTANHAFRAISLDRGNHVVKFVYDPLSFRFGLWISAFVFFLMLAYLIRNKIS